MTSLSSLAKQRPPLVLRATRAMNYRKGRAYEHEVRHLLEENGYEVSRAAGSKGATGWDLIARKRTGRTTREVWLQLFLQVKIKRGS